MFQSDYRREMDALTPDRRPWSGWTPCWPGAGSGRGPGGGSAGGPPWPWPCAPPWG